MTRNKSYNKTASLVLCGLFAALTAICAYINIPLGFTPIPMNLAMLAVFLAGGILGKKYGTVSITVYVLMGAAGLPVFAGFQSGIAVIVGPTGGFLAGYIATAFIVGFSLDAYEKRHASGGKAHTTSQRSRGSGEMSRRMCQSPHCSGETLHAMCQMPHDSSETSHTMSQNPQCSGETSHALCQSPHSSGETSHAMCQMPHSSGETSHALCHKPRALKRRKLALCIFSMLIGIIVCYALGTLWFMTLTGTGLYASLAACVLPFIPGDIIKIIAASLLTMRLRHLA